MLTGDSNVSPSVLANLWKEEEARTKTLEEKMRVLLKDKEVCRLEFTYIDSNWHSELKNICRRSIELSLLKPNVLIFMFAFYCKKNRE